MFFAKNTPTRDEWNTSGDQMKGEWYAYDPSLEVAQENQKAQTITVGSEGSISSDQIRSEGSSSQEVNPDKDEERIKNSEKKEDKNRDASRKKLAFWSYADWTYEEVLVGNPRYVEFTMGEGKRDNAKMKFAK